MYVVLPPINTEKLIGALPTVGNKPDLGPISLAMILNKMMGPAFKIVNA